MKRMLYILFCLCSLITSGQTSKLSNTLLWRISGKGLTRPSYLYGTMHLTDKRVFQLGDSLYNGIEQTDGFAGELDMNTVGMQMVNNLIADKEAKAAREAVKVKDAVSPAVWERYKGQLEERFYKSADMITVDDLEDVGSSLESDILKKGDMPTFLDAYLFGIARRQGKWVGGLEDFRDQTEHINSESIEQKIQTALFDDKYYRVAIERMIRIYTAQRLDSIDVSMYREENGQKDYIMIKRNLKMARMMDSLSTVRSTFFAVGAAHLPGDSGVIALLQGKGFTVTPVFSSKKINPDKYVFKSKESPWLAANIKDSSYHVEMPGVSENIEMLESMGLNMKMFFDISFMKMYMTVGVELSPARKNLGRDSLYHSMRARFFNKSKDVKERAITINGFEGREYVGSLDDAELRVQVFMPAMEELIVNAVISLTKKTVNDPESERFFGSFAYNGLPKIPVDTENVWTTLNYPSHLFSIDWPIKPRETKDVKSAEGKIIYLYQGMDIKNQVFYGLSVTSVKEGRYSTSYDSSYFLSVKDRVRLQMENGRILDSAFVNFMGYPGYRFTLAGKSQGDVIETKVISIARGNRNYYLFTVYSPDDKNRMSADKYLGSFRLLSPPRTEWKTSTAPDSSFSVVSTVPLKKIKPAKEDFHWDAERFSIYDSINATTTFIDKTILPEWLWFSSDTAFLRRRARQYKGYNDSIQDYAVIVKGTQSVCDFTVTTPGTRLVKKVKLVLNGNELFEMFGHVDPLDYKETSSRIFDQFIAMKESAYINRTSSRINELSQVLEKGDLEEVNRVALWWHNLQFSKSDLPMLQKLLFTLYPDFDSSYYGGINGDLFDKVRELDSANTTIDYIKRNLGNMATKDEQVIPYIIRYLAAITTSESYAVLKTILLQQPLKQRAVAYPLYRLYDSLKLSTSLYPEILTLADSKVMGSFVQSLTGVLLDSGMISKKMVIDNGKRFINYARTQLDNYKDMIAERPFDYYDCIKILGIINTAESNAVLTRFANLDDRGIRFKTLIAQLRNNQSVDSRTIYTMATTDEYRFELYDELKKMGKLKLFPVSFLSQAELGKSKLYQYASTKTSPALISYVGERTIVYKGRQRKFLLYRVDPGDFSGSQLGVAGPYSLDSKDYSSSNEATGIYHRKGFDAKKLDTLFKEYLQFLDEENDEEKEIQEPPPPRF